MSTLPPLTSILEANNAVNRAELNGQIRRKVIIYQGIAIDVREREVQPQEVGDTLGRAALNSALKNYAALSNAAKRIISPDVVGRDNVAHRIYNVSDSATTAGSSDDVEAAAESHNFYLYEITGEVSPGPDEEERRVVAPYPTRIIETPRRRSSLRIIREDANGKNGASTFTTLFSTSDFFLQRVSENDAEKYQIIETFGDPMVYFYNRRARIWTFAGTMFNTENLSWANNWAQDWDREMRGTQTVRNKARVYISYGKKIVEGYLLSFNQDTVAESDNGVSFVFNLLVTKVNHIRGVSKIGKRNLDRTDSPFESYLGGQDPFSTAEWRDRVHEEDPMKVLSLSQLENAERGAFVAEGNASVFLAAERYIQETGTIAPLVGFVAVPKDDVSNTSLLSVTFSDPLANDSGIDSFTRQLVAEKPEGLITVPPTLQGSDQKVWEASRPGSVKRIVLMDAQQAKTDSAVLQAYRDGARVVPHYFVCRGDSSHPQTLTQLAPGQIIQLVQEKYTSFVLEQVSASVGAEDSGIACDSDYPSMLGSDKPKLRASDLTTEGANRTFEAKLDASNPNVTGMTKQNILAAGGNLSRNGRIIHVSGNMQNLISLETKTGGEGKAYAGVWATTLLNRYPVSVAGDSLATKDLLSVMASLLYQESPYYRWEGPDAVGPVISSTSRSAAGIGQFLPDTAREQGLRVERTRSPEDENFQLNRPNLGPCKVGPDGNVIPLEDVAIGEGGFAANPFTREVRTRDGRTWIDDRFCAFRSVPAAAKYLLTRIREQINLSGRYGVSQPQTLWDAVLFGIAAYNQGGGAILNARKAAKAANSSAGGTYCSVVPRWDDSNSPVRLEGRQYVHKIVDRWYQGTKSRRSSDENSSSGPTDFGGTADGQTIYVAINGPSGASGSGGFQAYTSEQVFATIKLINDIARRNGGVVELWGRKHVGGMRVLSTGDGQLRFSDPATANLVDSGFSADHLFDFNDDRIVARLRKDGATKNAERTMKGKQGQWWP